MSQVPRSHSNVRRDDLDGIGGIHRGLHAESHFHFLTGICLDGGCTRLDFKPLWDIQCDGECICRGGVVEDLHRHGRPLACFDLLPIGMDANPLFVQGIVRIIPGEEFLQQFASPFQDFDHVTQLILIETERLHDVLIDQQGVSRDLVLQKGKTVGEPGVRTQQVAVLQAVVVESGRRE